MITWGGNKKPLISHGHIGGELSFEIDDLKDRQTSPNSSRRGKATILREKLMLETEGEVVHPNFLEYAAAVGFGLAQERASGNGRFEEDETTLSEYDISLQFLQTKPYPITFHANRDEELVSRQFLGALKSQTENWGFLWSLRSKILPMRIQYDNNKIRQSSFTSFSEDFYNRDDERFRYSVSHKFSENSKIDFEFARNIISQQSQAAPTHVEEDRYVVSHNYSFGENSEHNLGSYLSHIKQDGTFTFKNTVWNERLFLRHTEDFSTEYEFRLTDSERYIFDNTETLLRAGFEHILYDNLTTTGDIFWSENDVDGQGLTTQRGESISFDYYRNLPWGRFQANYMISHFLSEQDTVGTVGAVTNEQHTANTIILVELDKRNIDTSSIVVKTDTVTAFQEGDDYEIVVINDRTMLRMFDPPQLGAAFPNFTDGQQIYVDYEFFLDPDREEDTRRQDLVLRQNFDNGMYVYYKQQRQDEDVSSSLASIIPDEYRTKTYGAGYSKEGFAFLAETSERESTHLPYKSRLMEASLGIPFSNDTLLKTYASQRWMEFGEPDAHDVDLFRLGGSIFNRISDKYTVMVDINYRDEHDTKFGDTEGFQLESSLNYTYRQVNFSLGWEYNKLTRRSDDIDNLLFFFRLSRYF